MNNPFDPKQEEHKFVFFQQMTEAINEWMLKKYPEFDNTLIQRIKHGEILQKQLHERINSFSEKIPEIQKQLQQKIIEEINTFLKKERPDIDKSLNLTAKRLEKKDKDLLERNKKIDEKLKTFKIYESLCEDVYKLRDEFKEIEKFMTTFKKKIKVAFDIKD